MDVPELDEYGYPTDETLQAIREWRYPDVQGVLDFIARAWHWPDFGVSRELEPHEAELLGAEDGERFLRLATGGWSGNEDLIDAFNENLNYMLCWKLSAVGGLEIFEYSPIDGEVAEYMNGWIHRPKPEPAEAGSRSPQPPQEKS